MKSSKCAEWIDCDPKDRKTLPPPGVRVVIAVPTKYKDAAGDIFIWKPYAIRSEPEYMTALGMIKETRIPISKVKAWTTSER